MGVLENSRGDKLQEITARFDGMVMDHTIALGVIKGDSLVACGRFE